ncbi:hypothetical protein B0H16DRAFT_1709752 [Mycena metata]|uniref:Uncharacterized protein n=1 Tax=Mycena metata TaxID=1033252 RepID=A0AAD7P0P0_9AGAR|nr:hypothetical protein B0H16DRAFT_1741801 [Mycena metata]KAJ7782923.1 hypothetical protein B0H16DRAFT_1709752 [Mycena metata]
MPADRAKRSTPTPRTKRNQKKDGTTREPAFKFQGERLVFLNQRLELFYDATARRDLHQFWVRLFAEYWHIFPWRLPIDEDPHCGMLTDSSTTINHEDIDKKTAIILNTQMRVKGWFYHKRVRANLGLP